MAAGTHADFHLHARKDGADLARRLAKDLTEHGCEVWLDTEQIAGGARWSKELQDAIDAREVFLAVLTNGYEESDICSKELSYALSRKKRVIPFLGRKGAPVPFLLNDVQWVDELPALLRALGQAAPPPRRAQLMGPAPTLPANHVERPAELAALREAVLSDAGGRGIALTAVKGMGGIGKTLLARALCDDPAIKQAFPDGIVWVTVGREPAGDLCQPASGSRPRARRRPRALTIPSRARRASFARRFKAKPRSS